MLLSLRHSFFLLTAASFIFACWFLYRPSSPSFTLIPSYPVTSPTSSIIARPTTPVLRRPEESAGNETLGFEKILALSSGPSWRTRGLEAAANLTGLRITIPPQPPILPDIAVAFEHLGPQADERDHPTYGGSKAWLAHLDIIKHAYQSNFDTTLIIEDDVDWDIAIRNQMKQIATAIRNLTHTDESEDAPYGRAWDVLWIGHCGEYWEEGYETVSFDDEAVCPHAEYFGWAQGYISRLPDYKRSVYWSSNPVCSFAYALSHNGARRVLELTGSAQGEAFDVKMMGECKTGGLKCISVVPEVIHQYFPAGEFGVKSLVDIGNGDSPGPEDGAFEAVKGSTENILQSARCQALWGETCLRK